MNAPYEVETLESGDLNHLCGMRISIQFESSKDKYYCRCRGVSPLQYIIVQMPGTREAEALLSNGGQLILRYVYNGTVYGFKVSIIRTIKEPFRLVFTTYPENIERHSLRNHERIEVIIPAQFSMSGNSADVVIRDLSSGGCMLVIDSSVRGEVISFDEADLGFLRFSCELFKDELNVACRIVRIRADQEKTQLGIQFDSSDSEVIDRVSQYVDHILNALA